MNFNRKTKLSKDFRPLPAYPGDEIQPNGIFNFNISRILERIAAGKLDAEEERIPVKEWFKSHIRGRVNEDHLPTLDITKPILQGEIRPGRFEIIDGNRRMDKAYRYNVEFVIAFKLKGVSILCR